MKIYIFKDSYYVGNCEDVIKNAIKSEEITVPEGKSIKIVNGEVNFVEKEKDFGGETV
jgi:hypothetical protein